MITYTTRAEVRSSSRGNWQREMYLTTTRRGSGGLLERLHCPVSGRRARKLYLPQGSRTFACRACHRLTCWSCQENHRHDSFYRRTGRTVVPVPCEVELALQMLYR